MVEIEIAQFEYDLYIVLCQIGDSGVRMLDIIAKQIYQDLKVNLTFSYDQLDLLFLSILSK